MDSKTLTSEVAVVFFFFFLTIYFFWSSCSRANFEYLGLWVEPAVLCNSRFCPGCQSGYPGVIVSWHLPWASISAGTATFSIRSDSRQQVVLCFLSFCVLQGNWYPNILFRVSPNCWYFLFVNLRPNSETFVLCFSKHKYFPVTYLFWEFVVLRVSKTLVNHVDLTGFADIRDACWL